MPLIDRYPSLQPDRSALVVEDIVDRIPPERRLDVNTILDQVRSTFPQKRALLLKQGLSRVLIDEIEILSESSESSPVIFPVMSAAQLTV